MNLKKTLMKIDYDSSIKQATEQNKTWNPFFRLICSKEENQEYCF